MEDNLLLKLNECLKGIVEYKNFSPIDEMSKPFIWAAITLLEKQKGKSFIRTLYKNEEVLPGYRSEVDNILNEKGYFRNEG